MANPATKLLYNITIQGPLTTAEARLIASLDPQKARSDGDGGAPVPRGAVVRDGETVRASLIRDLCTSPSLASGRHGLGITIESKRITGELDLSFCTVSCPLTFRNCDFEEGVKLHHARLEHLAFRGGSTLDIYANGAVIRGDVILSEKVRVNGTVSLVSARIGGSLKFGSARVGVCRRRPRARVPNADADPSALACDGVDVGGSVFLDNKFKAYGQVRLTNARVRGRVHCDEARLANKGGFALMADFLKARGGVDLWNACCRGEVRMIGAECCGNIEFDGGRFYNPGQDSVILDNVRVKGSVFLRDRFRARGRVGLAGAWIGLDVDCDGGSVTHPRPDPESGVSGITALSGARMRVKGNVYLDNFEACGEVRLTGAYVGGLVRCKAPRLLVPDPTPETEWIGKQSLNAEGITVAGSVEITGGTTNGILDFRNSRIGRNLTVKQLALEPGSVNGLLAEYARIRGELCWARTKATKGTKFLFTHARLGGLRHGRDSWPITPSRMRLRGCTYGTIELTEPPLHLTQPSGASGTGQGQLPPRDEADSRRWMELQDCRTFDPQPYEQLAVALRREGHDDEAKRVRIELENARLRHGGLSMEDRVLNRVLGWSIQHGYSTYRVLLLSLVAIVGGSILFWHGNMEAMVPASEDVILDSAYQETGEPPAGYPAFNPAFYSLDAFLPIVDLHQETFWLPDAKAVCTVPGTEWRVSWCGGFLRAYLWIHIIFGWAFTTLIVLSFTGLVRRPPDSAS